MLLLLLCRTKANFQSQFTLAEQITSFTVAQCTSQRQNNANTLHLETIVLEKKNFHRTNYTVHNS